MPAPRTWQLRRTRARRRVAVVAVLVLFLGIAVPATGNNGTAKGSAWPSAAWLWSWLSPAAWASPAPIHTPRQQTGTADGLSHSASAASTRSGRGAGQAPGTGAGQLAAYGPSGKAAKPAKTAAATGGGAQHYDQATSKRVPSAATATSDLYQNADGTYTRRLSAAPLNFQAADGSWQPIDTRIAVGADHKLRVGSNRVAAAFAGSGGDAALVSLAIDSGHSIAYALQGAAPVSPVVSGSTVTYPGVLPGTDLTLDSLAGGVKESIVLHSAQAAASWTFPLSLRGLTARVAADGSVQFADASGRVVGRIPHGYMHDSASDPRTGAAESDRVTYSIVTAGGGQALKMTADAAWLHDPARVFPVTIDPTYASDTTGSTFVLSDAAGDYSGRTDLRIGTADSGGEIANGFVAFSGLGTTLSGDHITAAQLNLFDFWASACTAQRFDVAPVTAPWTVSGSKSYPGPGYGASIGNLTADPGAACTNTALSTAVGTWMSVPLDPATFNTWTSGGSNNGLAVYGSSTGTLTYKRFDSANTANPPVLLLTYAPNQPPQIDTMYPPANYNAPTLTPELIALGHDPDAYPVPVSLKYDFTVYSSAGAQLATSGSIAANSWSVPAGTLSWGQSYLWTAQDYDGLSTSAATSASAFTTTVPQPLITSGLSQNSSDHGIDPAAGNYTTSETDAQVQSVGPALDVERDYNSLDPRTSGAFGAGWSALYDARAATVLDQGGTVTGVLITYPTGEQVEFGRNPDGTYASPIGRYSTLTALSTGYKLVDKSGTAYTFGQATATAGSYALTSISDYQGRGQTFGYAGGQLTTQTSAVSGRALHFTWTTPPGAASAHVASVTTDPAAAAVPSSAQTWTYSYTGDQLTTVCPPTSSTACTGYSYTGGSHFRTTVLDAGPRDYWRLNDAAGGTAASDQMLVNENTLNGAYSTAAMAGGPAGPLADGLTSASFDGSTGAITLPNSLLTATTYLSIGMWFKTTATTTGTLFSTGHSALGTANPDAGAMPVLYVGSDGRLYGHFWDSSVAGITSASAVNDGAWHQVVLTSAGNTQTLYLDGAAVGSQSGQLSNIDPIDLVGAGVYNNDGWPAAPSGGNWNHFTGQIAEVGYYTRPLPAPVIAQQWSAAHTAASLLSKITLPSGKTETSVAYNTADDNVKSLTDVDGGTYALGAPTVAGSSETYAGAVLGSAPTDYWRLGETGVTQAVNQVRGGTATYSGVTLGVTGAFGAGEDTAASFDGASSYLQLPTGLFPSGSSSQELWFNTTAPGAVLLSSQSGALGGSGTGLPALWITPDGRLRGLSPSTSPNGPFDSGLAGKCVDDAGGATADGTHVQISDCTGAANQNWTMYADGTVRDYGKCLDVSGGATANGTPVDLSACTGAAKQVWQVYQGGLRNPVSGRCLEDPGASTANGTQLDLRDCSAAAASQGWTQSLATTASVTDGKWHHAVLTTTGTAQSLYLDGALAQSTAGSVTLTPGAQPYAYLGAGYTGAGASGLTANTTAYFAGSLDEAAFYPSALSAADVARHWAAYKSAYGIAPVETVKLADPGGYTTTYALDPQNGNRQLSITDGLGDKTSYGYDVGGYLNTTTDPGGAVTTTGHDVRGNVVSETTCQNQATNTCSTKYYTYYPDDTTAAPAWDPRNDMLLTERDGRSSSATDNRYLTSYTYDSYGNRTSTTTPPVAGFPSGRTSTTVYTNGASAFPAADGGNAPTGLVASTTTPGGAVTTVVYYQDGDPARVTDPSGQVTTYTYDGLGRVLTKTELSSSYPAGLTSSYTYDGLNRPLTATDPPVTDRVTGAVHTARTTSVYDVDGENLSTTVSDLTGGDAPRTTTNTYGASDRLATTTTAVNAVTSFTYDAAGNKATQTDPGGVVTAFGYDANQRLTTTTVKNYTGDPVNPSPATDLVVSSRAYDPAGRLASIADSMGWVVSYTYTDDGLTSTVTRKDPSTGASFVQQSNYYDAAGNMVGQYTNNGTTYTAYTVDAASRTTAATLDPSGVNRTTSNTFSPDDYVLSARISDAASTASATDTTYDALGRKTSQSVHNDTTGHPAGWWPLSDGSASGSPTTANYAADSSGAGDTATLSGSGATWSAGATFNGSTAAVADSGPVVSTTGDFSVSVWVDPAALSSSAWQTFVSQQGARQAVFDLEYDPTSAKWAFTRALADTAAPSFVHAESSTAAVAGAWTHLVGTYKASTGAMTLYVNGAAAGTATDTTPIASSGPLVAGHGYYNSAAVNYANAQIADVQVYGRTLAAADTTTLYAYGRTGPSLATPAAWWKLTDGVTNPAAATAQDSSGSGYTGALSGGAAWSSGVSFNATNGSVTTGGTAVATSGDYSVSLWVDPVALTSSAWQAFAVQPASQQGGLYIEYDPTSGKWAFSRALTDTANAAFVHAESGAAATAGTWTHLVGTYKASTGAMTLYVNGAATGTATDTTPFASSGSLIIGHGYFNGAANNFANAQIADVQVYGRTLSSAEASTMYGYGRAAGALNSSLLTTRWTVDTGGSATSSSDPLGNTTTYSYDEAGRLALTVAPTVSAETGGNAAVAAHPISTTGYDAFGETVESEDPNGNITVAGYDAAGEHVSTTLPSYTAPGSTTPTAATTSTVYDAEGHVTSETNALNQTTSYTYDQLGDVSTATDPANNTAHYTYDTDGDKLTSTDPGGSQAQATYDYLGRQVTSTDVVRQNSTAFTTTNAYADTAGYLSSTTSPTGVVTGYGYNAVGDVTRVVDEAGQTTTKRYDALGRLVADVLPDQTSTTSTYDEAGRPTAGANLDSLGVTLRTTSTGYDAAGHAVAVTDALNHTTTLAYDATGMVTGETQPVSASSAITTSFGYDMAGNRTRFTDGRGNAFITTYNAWNLPESTIEPATPAYPNAADRTFTAAYDATGQVATATSPGGVVVTNAYDSRGNLTSQTGTGAAAATDAHTLTYDASDRLVSANAPGGTDNFTYDDRGLVLSTSGPSGSSAFSYNGDGQLTARTDAAGTSAYAYDSAGRLSTIADPSSGATLTLGYDKTSQVTSVNYGSGAATRTYTYNSLHEPTSDTLANPSGSTEASIAYGYDLNGNETSKTTTGITGASANTYTYDYANRLASWNNGATTVGYAYDASGNRTQNGTNTLTYDARNELTSDGTSTYTYTPRGTLSLVTGSGTTAASTSDAFNRVITDGGQTYSYDALDRVVSGGGNTFSYSGMTNDAASDGVFSYSRDPSGALIGAALSGSGSGTGALVLTDQHTDVVANFTATGSALAGSTTYDPFGQVLATSAMTGHLGYQSGWTDPSTAKVNMASRWYSPATGQFSSRDTVGNSPVPNSASANRFAYVDDNPLIATDPTGHCGLFDWGCYINSGVQAVKHVYNTYVAPIVHQYIAPVVHQVVHAVTSNPVVRAVASYTYNTYIAPVVSAWHAVVKTATAVVHKAVAIAHQIYHVVTQARNTAVQIVKKAVSYTVHTVTTAVKKVQDAYTYVQHKVTTTVTQAVAVYKKQGLLAAANYVGQKAVAAQVAVNSAVTSWAVQHADIVSFAVGTGAFLGCEAVLAAGTAGVGAVLGGAICGAVSGAVGGLVSGLLNQANKCQSGAAGACSASAYLVSGGVSALAGGLAGGLGGALAAPLSGVFGSMTPEAMPSVLGKILGGSMSGTVLGGAGSGLSYGISCAASSSCSRQGLADAVSTGSAWGAAGGAAGGLLDYFGSRSSTSTTADDTTAGSACTHSFDPATKVLMADGSTKELKDVKTGDKVASTDPATGKNTAEPVQLLHDNHDTDLADVTVQAKDGTKTVLHTTWHHPFWNATANQWTDAANLKPGTQLDAWDGDNYAIKVVSVKTWTGLHDMRDLTVASQHTYFVMAGLAPVLVHNCGRNVVLGINEFQRVVNFTNKMTAATGNTFEHFMPADPGALQSTSWMGKVTNALGDPNATIHVLLDGFDGVEKPSLAVRSAITAGDNGATGTRWEMSKLNESIWQGGRDPSTVHFYRAGGEVPMPRYVWGP